MFRHEAGLPNILSDPIGNFPAHVRVTLDSGALQYIYGGNSGKISTSENALGYGRLGFDASVANVIYGSSNTVTPLSITTIFAIKY